MQGKVRGFLSYDPCDGHRAGSSGVRPKAVVFPSVFLDRQVFILFFFAFALFVSKGIIYSSARADSTCGCPRMLRTTNNARSALAVHRFPRVHTGKFNLPDYVPESFLLGYEPGFSPINPLARENL